MGKKVGMHLRMIRFEIGPGLVRQENFCELCKYDKYDKTSQLEGHSNLIS